MLWIQIWIVSLLYTLCSSFRTRPTSTSTTTTKHPYPRDEKWAEQVMSRHLVNMTDNLIRDLQDKYEAAMRIQDSYKHSKSYELGYLAAGVQEKFKLMLEIYRTCANIKDFMNKTFNVEELLDAYHVMQGYYNELKAQKALYYDILAKYKRIYETREEFFNVLNDNCPANKKKFKKVPDDVLQNNAYIIHNLKAYKVIIECENDKAVRKAVGKVEWPPPSRRHYTDLRDLIEETEGEEDYKALKWSVKSEDFKAIEEINTDPFT